MGPGASRNIVRGMSMNITYTEKARQSRGYELLRKASDRLMEIVRDPTEPMSAEWDRTEDEKGGDVYVLRLKDPYGDLSREFTPDDLRSANQTAFGLYRIWGDLHAVQTRKR